VTRNGHHLLLIPLQAGAPAPCLSNAMDIETGEFVETWKFTGHRDFDRIRFSGQTVGDAARSRTGRPLQSAGP
jgi:hypothetical protein